MTDPGGEPAPQPAEPVPPAAQPLDSTARMPATPGGAPPAAPVMSAPQQPSGWRRTARSRPLQLIAIGLLGLFLGLCLGGGAVALVYELGDRDRPEFGRGERCTEIHDRDGNRRGVICEPRRDGDFRGPKQLPPGQYPPGKRQPQPSPS